MKQVNHIAPVEKIIITNNITKVVKDTHIGGPVKGLCSPRVILAMIFILTLKGTKLVRV